MTFGPGELEKEISFPLDQSPMKDKNGKYIFSASDLTGDAILSDILGSLAVEVKHDIKVRIFSRRFFSISLALFPPSVSMAVRRVGFGRTSTQLAG